VLALEREGPRTIESTTGAASAGCVPQIASRGFGRRLAETRPRAACVLYNAVRPAVALIVGAGRAWTVSMISELSIPCR